MNQRNDLIEELRSEFADREYRHHYADSFLDTFMASQLAALREARGMTQAQLGELSGMKQSQISRLEDASYSGRSISSLKRLAKAFDLRLSVRFESFGTIVDETLNSSPEQLQRPSFAEEPVFASPNAKLRITPVRSLSLSAIETSMPTKSGFELLARIYAALPDSAFKSRLAELHSALIDDLNDAPESEFGARDSSRVQQSFKQLDSFLAESSESAAIPIRTVLQGIAEALDTVTSALHGVAEI